MRLSLSYPAVIVATSLGLAVLRAAPAAGPVEFVAHDIDAKMPGAYAVNTADFNKDHATTHGLSQWRSCQPQRH